MIKFVDNIIVIGRITSSNEAAHRAEVENLESWNQLDPQRSKDES